MAEPAGAPAVVVLAVGATNVERWAPLGAVVAAPAVAAVGLEPKKPKPLDESGVLGVEGFTLTAVLAGVGAGAVAWRLVDEEPKEPKPPLGLEGAGAAVDWAGAEGLEGAGAAVDWAGAEGLEVDDDELEPKEPKLDRLELEEDELLELDDEELEELDFAASAKMGLIAKARLSIATRSSEVRDLVIRVFL